MSLSGSIKKILKKLASKAGYEINPIGSRGLGYISVEEITQKASSKNQTVHQYLEDLWGLYTHALKVVKQFGLDKLKDQNDLHIVEIGAGTGAYLSRLIEILGSNRIANYQVYETASDWAQYLKKNYPIELSPANGYQLNSTETASVDLVHAHGVFVYTSFITSMSYLREMARVVKPGGIIAFDLFDESGYDEHIITKWIDSGHTYMNIVPEKNVLEQFPKSDYTLLTTFHAEFEPGRSRYFVFQKR